MSRKEGVDEDPHPRLPRMQSEATGQNRGERASARGLPFDKLANGFVEDHGTPQPKSVRILANHAAQGPTRHDQHQHNGTTQQPTRQDRRRLRIADGIRSATKIGQTPDRNDGEIPGTPSVTNGEIQRRKEWQKESQPNVTSITDHPDNPKQT